MKPTNHQQVLKLSLSYIPACPGGGRLEAGNATRLLSCLLGAPDCCPGLELKLNIGGSFHPLSWFPKKKKNKSCSFRKTI